MSQDEEHLRLLSIFHYVVGGLAGLFALFPIFHLVVGLIMIVSPRTLATKGNPPPEIIGWMFVIFAGVFIVVGLAFGSCVIIAGRFLARRKHYLFCFVIGALECVFMPFGTVLGVFTIIVLMRESVKRLFTASNAAGPIAAAPGM